MAFLNPDKKDSEDLKPLSENEIQKKLYGHVKKSPEVPEVPETSEISENDSPEIKLQEPPQEKLIESEGEESPAIGDLFSPPEEVEEEPKMDSAPETKPSPEASVSTSVSATHIKAEAVSPYTPAAASTTPKSKKTFLRPLPSAPKLSFALPQLKKWPGTTKLKNVPITTILVAFFAAVLLMLMVRSVDHWVSKISAAREAGKSETSQSSASQATPAIAVPVTLPAQQTTPPPSEPLSALEQSLIPRKFYTIQIAVYNGAKRAGQLVEEIKSRGFDAYYREGKTRNGRETYQVFVGHFQNYGEAENSLKSYRDEDYLKQFSDSFVRARVE